MCKKKIAVFSTVWNTDYQYAFLEGLQRGAQERDVDLYLFNTYGDSDRESDTFAQGEYSIFFLPDLKDFDGVLMASNNVGTRTWNDSLMKRVREAGVPCVGVEQQSGVDYRIGVDNYSAMYSMVEYLVRDKGCRVLNYVGGPEDNDENRARKQAFLDVQAKYGITCDHARIRDYSFRWEDGVRAYEEFKAEGLHLPDAVVCANDYMAIGYLKAAQSDGFNAPGDFLISGFDNIKEAQQYSPQVTTVDRSVTELGRRSVWFLDDLIEKRECAPSQDVPYRVVHSQSTGDTESVGSDAEFRRQLFETGVSNRMMRLHLKHLRVALLGNHSTDDFVSIMCHYAPLLGIKRFVMGIDASKIVDTSSQGKTFFGSFDGRLIRGGDASSGILPESVQLNDGKSHTYLFSPCHCSGKNYGYSVVIDNISVVREDMLSEWMLAVDDSVEDLRQSLNMQIMNRQLSELYRRDSLTGLYNRFALKEKGERLLHCNRETGTSTLIIFVDMDSLKKANDVYGHDMGDLALKTIADSIDAMCTDCLDFAVRYGGDEFLLLGSYPGPSETQRIMTAVETRITELGRSRKLPFELTVSTGYTEVEPDNREGLEHHIHCADQMMYEKKQRNRK